MIKIEIDIPASVKPADWLRVATRKARAEAIRRNVDWVSASIFVTLPEHGRCLIKNPGFENLGACG